MLLFAAALLEAAGRLAAAMQCSETFSDLGAQHKKSEPDKQALDKQAVSNAGHNSSHAKLNHRDARLIKDRPKRAQGVCSLSRAQQGLSQLFEGFWLIAKSGYLCHVCLHFVLHYLVSTFFYFEKTLVVASGGGSASQRVATFATINSMSAGAVALIQLTATVHHASSPLFHPCFTPVPPLCHPCATPVPPLFHPCSTPGSPLQYVDVTAMVHHVSLPPDILSFLLPFLI